MLSPEQSVRIVKLFYIILIYLLYLANKPHCTVQCSVASNQIKAREALIRQYQALRFTSSKLYQYVKSGSQPSNRHIRHTFVLNALLQGSTVLHRVQHTDKFDSLFLRAQGSSVIGSVHSICVHFSYIPCTYIKQQFYIYSTYYI